MSENWFQELFIDDVKSILKRSGSGGSSGTPIEVATEAEMEAILVNATDTDNGKVYRYTGETGTYKQGAYYILEV